jgi:hypothetical protein
MGGVSHNQGGAVHQVSLSAILSLRGDRRPSPVLPPSFPSLTTDRSLRESQATHSTGPTVESALFCETINKRFRDQVNGRFLLGDDIYAFAPELINPETPIRSSLETAEKVEAFFQKAPLKALKEPKRGLSGKVKFLHFKNDPDPERWFAIKRPFSIFNTIFQSGNPLQAALTKYENNLKIAAKIGNHPNFMKVHGIVVKKVKGGTKSKPYLVMEYIPGTILRDLGEVSKEEKIQLVAQLKNALFHLYNKKILPFDANHGNFLITPENELKLIDFDAWIDGSTISVETLAEGLYNIAGSFLKGLLQVKDLDMPLLPPEAKQDQELFSRALDQLFLSTAF